jgi:excisionase family DNA binding protein
MTMHTAPPGQPLLAQLIDKVDALEAMVGTLCTQQLPELESKLTGLRELLSRRRKDHLVVEEVAELTGRSCYTVRRWITEGKLCAIRIRDGGPRGKLLIPRTELDRLIGGGKGGGIPDTVLD